MGWGPVGDPLFLDEIYDQLTWNTPDVRKGVDFVNQFVAFWANDVEAALGESGPENGTEGLEWTSVKGRGRNRRKEKDAPVKVQMRQSRPTFEEFFESIEITPETWDFPFENVYGKDGWGAPAVPDADVAADTAKKKDDRPDAEGWVTQKGKIGKARGKKQTQRQPRLKEKGGAKKIATQNVFAQVGPSFHTGLNHSIANFERHP